MDIKTLIGTPDPEPRNTQSGFLTYSHVCVGPCLQCMPTTASSSAGYVFTWQERTP